MNCVIPGRGIRAFGKAIYCLAKIGEELYIEALPDGLALKTVNGARSAFASFHFQRRFFILYRDASRGGQKDLRHQQVDDEEPLKCKISIKSCVSVFKALSTLEKTVDRCSFYLDSQQNKLVFVFHCRHGIVKTHNLGFQECEALQAVFTKDLCPNRVVGPAKIVSEVVTNFPNSLEEVTMIAEPECVRLKNYVEDTEDGIRVSLTEISLAPQEFDDYQIGVDVAVTFCLKELRALLLFTDAINHSLSIRFEAPGKPVVFSIDDSDDYQADFVLATLLDGTSSSQPSSSVAAYDSHSSCVEVHPHKRTDNGRYNTNAHVHQDDLEDSISIEQSHSTYLPSQARGCDGQKRVSSKPAQDFTVVDFPSSSQFNNRRRNSKSLSSKSPNEAHVPPPPTDMDYMDIEPSSLRTSILNNKDGSTSITSTTRTEQLMDALFGVESDVHVAEEEDVAQRKSGVTKERVTSAVAALPDRAHDVEFLDNFPIEVNHMDKIQPLNTSAKLSLSRVQTNLAQSSTQSSQDSLINDSGFLPSTPPSKKVKRGAAPFDIDLFGNEPSSLEVLAPDSDEDSD